MELKALAARRDRWDLRCSLKLPDAVYILPQKSHLKFLINDTFQTRVSRLEKQDSSPVRLLPTVRSDVVVIMT